MNYTNLQLLQYNNPPKNKPQPTLNSQHPSYQKNPRSTLTFSATLLSLPTCEASANAMRCGNVTCPNWAKIWCAAS